jgi:hypothetical protein
LKHGAVVLAVPVTARREDTTALNCFREWIIKHIDTLFAFTQKLGMETEMKDIILVTGFHRTRSWYNVTSNRVEIDSHLSLGVKVAGASVNWQNDVWDPSRDPRSQRTQMGGLWSQGPSGEVCGSRLQGPMDTEQ